MNKSEKIDEILAWIESQRPTTKAAPDTPTILVPVRFKTDNEEDALFVRKLFLEVLPGLSLNSPREGSNPKYDGNQKWFVYGDIKLTKDGSQVKRRRRNDVGKKRGSK